MSEFKHRIQSKTPRWFRRIIRIGLIVAAAGGALLGSETVIPDFTLPEKIRLMAQWMVVSGLVAAAVSKTAKSLPGDDEEGGDIDAPNFSAAKMLLIMVISCAALASCSKKMMPQEKVDTTEQVSTTVEYVPVNIPVYFPGDTVKIHDTIPCKEVVYHKEATSSTGKTKATVDINNGKLTVDCKTDSLTKVIEQLQKNSTTEKTKTITTTIQAPPEKYIPKWVWWLVAINCIYVGLKFLNWKYKLGWTL